MRLPNPYYPYGDSRPAGVSPSPMTLGIDELRALDRLLDEALELAPHERGPWLEGLGAEFARVANTLRDLLARDSTSATLDILDRCPELASLIPELLARAWPDELSAGFAIGPYRLVRELGVGGMGRVAGGAHGRAARAAPWHSSCRRLRFIGRVLAERIARERGILGALDPHIARLYDAGIATTGQPYLALEYVEGRPHRRV